MAFLNLQYSTTKNKNFTFNSQINSVPKGLPIETSLKEIKSVLTEKGESVSREESELNEAFLELSDYHNSNSKNTKKQLLNLILLQE